MQLLHKIMWSPYPLSYKVDYKHDLVSFSNVCLLHAGLLKNMERMTNDTKMSNEMVFLYLCLL
jgi:hypothetical protein